MYVPYEQRPGSRPALIVRGRANTPVSQDALRRLVASVDRSVAILGGWTLLDRLQGELRPQRTASAWIAAFGMIALLLAAIGLYGVVSYAVSQRTAEIGVRMALGATAGSVVRLILRQSFKPVAIGAVIGLLGAIAATRLLASQLVDVYGVSRTDPLTIVLVAATLITVALAASAVPAKRAAAIDPTKALAAE